MALFASSASSGTAEARTYEVPPFPIRLPGPCLTDFPGVPGSGPRSQWQRQRTFGNSYFLSFKPLLLASGASPDNHVLVHYCQQRESSWKQPLTMRYNPILGTDED